MKGIVYKNIRGPTTCGGKSLGMYDGGRITSYGRRHGIGWQEVSLHQEVLCLYNNANPNADYLTVA